MKQQRVHFEARWPVMLAILSVLLLLAMLPERIRVFPDWFHYALAVLVLVPMGLIRPSGGEPRWLRVSRYATLFFCVVGWAATMAILTYLVNAMLDRPQDISGLQLLASSTTVWALNVLMFSVLYWQMDRGGPEARTNDAGVKPDWLFPQESVSPAAVPTGWRPVFIDYLYLGYSTATAFSTTEAVPLTARAKLLMMLEGTISLVTIVVVASRAINILGT